MTIDYDAKLVASIGRKRKKSRDKETNIKVSTIFEIIHPISNPKLEFSSQAMD